MRKFIAFIVILAVAYIGGRELGLLPASQRDRALVENADDVLLAAFERKVSDLQVSGEGVVVRLLPDDENGSRHQRFILKRSSGQTLLVAHNIDLAPKLLTLEVGERVEFLGVYEWNDEGGVIHWTHHDPNGNHPGGWLKYRGLRFE